MNGPTLEPKENESEEKVLEEMNWDVFKADVYVKEGITVEEPLEEISLAEVESYTEEYNPELFTPPEDADFRADEMETSNQDTFLAAWWHYKKTNKFNKRKRKMLEICREEDCEEHNSELFTPVEEIELKEEETETGNQDALLAAWWDYKRTNKLKKKKNKRKILEIFRDENYWASDRFTDDEDFNYTELE